MKELRLKDDFIKLGQALKAAGMVSSGVDAKMVIQSGDVSVNGSRELRRGRKLRDGDLVEFDGELLKIIGGETDDHRVGQLESLQES